jgi:SAF domain
MALASVVVVFVSIAGFAELYASANHQVAVLIVTQTIEQGQRVSGNDLGQTSADISGGVTPIPVSQASLLSGKRAAVTIPAGSLLTAGDVTVSPSIPAGDAVVGLALKPGQLPASGVEPGDRVMIIQTAAPGTPLVTPNSTGSASGGSGASTGVLVPQARVSDVEAPPGNPSGAESQLVSVEVSSTVASAVSTAANADQVSLVLLPAVSGDQGNHGQPAGGAGADRNGASP